MRILFYPANLPKFNAYTLIERPMGGIVTGVIRLAEALTALGHDVGVLTKDHHPPLSKPVYLQFDQYEKFGKPDILVAVRSWMPIFSTIPRRFTLFWTGDNYQNLNTIGLGDKRVVDKLDFFVAVSDWHGKKMCEATGFPIEKMRVLTNGIYLPYFEGKEQRIRKRLIYSTTPSRGLKHLPNIFRELKKRHADLELVVYSSFDRYARDWPPINEHEDAEYFHLFKELSELPGCVVHKSILQRDLAREFMKASVFVYPSSFLETSCITALEALAAGCPIVGTRIAALPETVGDAGILIEKNVDTVEYLHDFVASVDRLLSDDAYWHEMSERCLERAKKFDWMRKAKDFIAFAEEKLVNS
jgi:glycosyltransferase involved in cell wall biosynthesis